MTNQTFLSSYFFCHPAFSVILNAVKNLSLKVYLSLLVYGIIQSFEQRMNDKENPMKFFNPTSELKELQLLSHIEKNPATTQKEIAGIINGAASMVNVYIDSLEEKDYLKRDYISLKTVHYNITPAGLKRKNYLSIVYMHELIKLYRMAEENIESFFIALENKGYKNILLYGAGEVAEIMLNIINLKPRKMIKVTALIDDNPKIQNTEVLGHSISSPDKISTYPHDAIVITSYTFEDDIRKRLDEIGYPEERVHRFFTEQII